MAAGEDNDIQMSPRRARRARISRGRINQQIRSARDEDEKQQPVKIDYGMTTIAEDDDEEENEEDELLISLRSSTSEPEELCTIKDERLIFLGFLNFFLLGIVLGLATVFLLLRFSKGSTRSPTNSPSSVPSKLPSSDSSSSPSSAIGASQQLAHSPTTTGNPSLDPSASQVPFRLPSKSAFSTHGLSSVPSSILALHTEKSQRSKSPMNSNPSNSNSLEDKIGTSSTASRNVPSSSTPPSNLNELPSHPKKRHTKEVVIPIGNENFALANT